LTAFTSPISAGRTVTRILIASSGVIGRPLSAPVFLRSAPVFSGWRSSVRFVPAQVDLTVYNATPPPVSQRRSAWGRRWTRSPDGDDPGESGPFPSRRATTSPRFRDSEAKTEGLHKSRRWRIIVRSLWWPQRRVLRCRSISRGVSWGTIGPG
jgi:hypothetical protein